MATDNDHDDDDDDNDADDFFDSNTLGCNKRTALHRPVHLSGLLSTLPFPIYKTAAGGERPLGPTAPLGGEPPVGGRFSTPAPCRRRSLPERFSLYN